MEAIANSKIGKSIAKSRPVKFVRRLLPLFLALWVQIDMFLDVRQSITYYSHGTVDGAYAKWALSYQNETNSTYLHSVSNTYLVCASVVWVASPLLLSLCNLWGMREPFATFTILTDTLFDYEVTFFEKHFGKRSNIMIGIISLPVDILASSVVIYILIPYMSLRRGIKIAWTGEDYDDEDELLPGFPAMYLTAFKSFEILGEAFPQLVLAVVFTSNNFPFLAESVTYFGVNEFTISLVSMIFSAGSLCFGLYTGIPEMFRRNLI